MAPTNKPAKGKIKEPNTVDPWEHRNDGLRCASCIWYCPKGGTVLGRCRRHAPTMSGYPAVYNIDWCGDHKLNEAFAGINLQEEN